MTSHKPLGWLIAESFMAAVARELSVLPANTSRVKSWPARLYSMAIGGLTELTADIGLGVSYLLGFRRQRRQGFIRVGEARAQESDGEDNGTPASEEIDASPKRSAPAWDRSLADRKLWLLKRSGLFGKDTKGAQIERACSLDDLRNAYKLVHDVYFGTGFIEPEAAGMRLRIF